MVSSHSHHTIAVLNAMSAHTDVGSGRTSHGRLRFVRLGVAGLPAVGPGPDAGATAAARARTAVARVRETGAAGRDLERPALLCAAQLPDSRECGPASASHHETEIRRDGPN